MQREFDFEPGLTKQFSQYMDLVAAAIYGSRVGLSGVAADLDRSPSELSRMLNRNPDDPRHLPVSDLPKIISTTEDRRLIYWLMEAFLEDPDAKQKRVIDDLDRLLPQIESLLQLVKR